MQAAFIMFKQITAFVLLIVFTIATFSKVVMIGAFFANQKYIAATLCENRGKPIVRCCAGKCFLQKQMNKEEKGNAQYPANGKEKIGFLFYTSPSPAQINEIALVDINPPSTDKSFSSQMFLKDCFHPPRV